MRLPARAAPWGGDRIALHVDGRRVEAAVVRRDRRSEAARFLLPEDPGERGPAFRSFIRERGFRATRALGSLPQRLAVTRMIKIPATRMTEVLAMAELQADRLVHGLSDRMAWGCERLGTFADGHTALRISVAPMEECGGLVSLAREAGWTLEDIETDFGAVTAGRVKASDPPTAIARLLDAEGQLGAWDGACPFFARGFPWDGSPDRLLEELLDSLEACRGERPDWRPARVLWLGLPPPETVAGSLAHALGVPVDVPSAPDPGAAPALATHGRRRSLVPLLPEAERERQRRRRISRQRWVFSALAGSAALLALGLGGREVRVREARLAGLRARSAELKRETADLARLADDLERGGRQGPRAAEVVKTVGGALPPRVSLSALTYERHGRVLLQGEAVNLDAALGLIQALEGTDPFTGAGWEGPGVTASAEGVRFSASAEFRAGAERAP